MVELLILEQTYCCIVVVADLVVAVAAAAVADHIGSGFEDRFE